MFYDTALCDPFTSSTLYCVVTSKQTLEGPKGNRFGNHRTMMILKNLVMNFETRPSKRLSDSFIDRRVKPCYQKLHSTFYSQSSQYRIRN